MERLSFSYAFPTPHHRPSSPTRSFWAGQLELVKKWRANGRGRDGRKLGQIFRSCRVPTSRSIKLVSESCPFSRDTVSFQSYSVQSVTYGRKTTTAVRFTPPVKLERITRSGFSILRCITNSREACAHASLIPLERLHVSIIIEFFYLNLLINEKERERGCFWILIWVSVHSRMKLWKKVNWD